MSENNIVGEGMIRILCDLTGLSGGLTNAREQTSAAMDGMSSKIQTAMSIASAAVYAAGAAMIALVMRATELGSKFHELAAETGMSTEELSRFAYAAITAHLSAEDVALSVGFLSKQMVATASAADTSSTAMGRLGINVKNADGSMRSTHDVLLDLSDVFKKLPDGAQKTQLAMEIFGRSGKQMIPMLNEGGDAIKNLESRADELGITVSSRFAEQAHEFGDQMAFMKTRIANTGRSLAEDMLPALNNTMHLLAGDFAGVAMPRATKQAGLFSSVMRMLSGDFDDFASKVEKDTGRGTSYMEFMFANWSRDIDAAISGMKYLGDTTATVLATPFVFLANTQQKKGAPADGFGVDGGQRGAAAVKSFWKGYWGDIHRINDEGGKALQDLENRYFKAEEDQAKKHAEEMAKIKTAAAAQADHDLQLEAIRLKEQLAQLDLQRVTAKQDATGKREAQKHPAIEAARQPVREYADGLALVAKNESIAQGANKDLANAVFVYTKRVLESTFANEDATRTIAAKKAQEEKELAVLKQQHATQLELLEATYEGYRLEKQRAQDAAKYAIEEAKKSIKNEIDRANAIAGINAELAAKLEVIRVKEHRDVEQQNRDSMQTVMALTLKGYNLELEQIDNEFRVKEDEARRTLALKSDLDARLIQLELEKKARMKALNDEYTTSLVRSIEIVAEEWAAKGPGLVQIVRDIFDEMHQSVSDVFFDVLTGDIHKLDDAFKSLFKSILRHITDMLADQVIKMLLDFIVHLIQQIAMARAAASTTAVLDLADFMTGFATGGIARGGLSFGAFASGASIIDRPTMALVGEGAMNEAIVPLPDGRSIPVRMNSDATRPLNVAISLAWTQELISSFKSSPNEISLVVNRELMGNGPIRKNMKVRG